MMLMVFPLRTGGGGSGQVLVAQYQFRWLGPPCPSLEGLGRRLMPTAAAVRRVAAGCGVKVFTFLWQRSEHLDRLGAAPMPPAVDVALSETKGPDAQLAIPTPDHYLPLLPLLGAGRAGEPVTFPVEGFDGGSMSMLAVKFG